MNHGEMGRGGRGGGGAPLPPWEVCPGLDPPDTSPRTNIAAGGPNNDTNTHGEGHNGQGGTSETRGHYRVSFNFLGKTNLPFSLSLSSSHPLANGMSSFSQSHHIPNPPIPHPSLSPTPAQNIASSVHSNGRPPLGISGGIHKSTINNRKQKKKTKTTKTAITTTTPTPRSPRLELCIYFAGRAIQEQNMTPICVPCMLPPPRKRRKRRKSHHAHTTNRQGRGGINRVNKNPNTEPNAKQEKKKQENKNVPCLRVRAWYVHIINMSTV